MKIFYFLLSIILFSTPLLSSDYNYNIEGIGTAVTKKMILNNGYKYLLYENNIGWTDNLGNFGKSFCFGRIKTKKEITDEFNLICETENQNGDKNWAEFSRIDTNMNAGAGNSRYIDGTGVYKGFIGADCIFSTKYLEEKFFFKSICKINTEVIKKMSR